MDRYAETKERASEGSDTVESIGIPRAQTSEDGKLPEGHIMLLMMRGRTFPHFPRRDGPAALLLLTLSGLVMVSLTPQAAAQQLSSEGRFPSGQKSGGQKYCPVMTSEEIDPETSPRVTYDGVTIYLCCDQCVTKFRRDPAAYLDPAIIPALQSKKLPARGLEQVYCPVLRDRKVSSKDPFTIYKGVKIYFYNDLARQRFEKDPERYADPTILPQLRMPTKNGPLLSVFTTYSCSIETIFHSCVHNLSRIEQRIIHNLEHPGSTVNRPNANKFSGSPCHP